MRNEADPERSAKYSRRDFVKGRFFRGLRHERNTAGEIDPAWTKKPEIRSLVMRYPKNQQQAETGMPVDETMAKSRHRMIPLLRPPGAIDEASFLQRCTKCGDCAKACPHQAIKWAGPQMRSAEGTPMILPEEQPCLMCSDFPCIQACPEDALTRQVPPMMGTARITEHLCLAYHGTLCSVCRERCPVSGAITWQQISRGEGSSTRPVVQESVCTGCGVCRYVCPAPENAILLMPTFHRPSPSISGESS